MNEVKYRKIGLYCNRLRPKVLALARSVYTRLEELGAEPLFSNEIEKHIGFPGKVGSKAEVCKNSEALVVLGGDGTLLMAARDSYPYQIPILGVSLGYLGFLSETSIDMLDEQLSCLVEGSFNRSTRLTLWVKVYRPKDDEIIFQSPVINEVHVFRQSRSRIVELQTHINHELLTHYRADGILISTPTGSTGHSLSAGGPILKPEMKAILITPVCPHTLASRSIIVDDKDVVEVHIQPEDQDVCISVDGQVDVPVCGGDRIEINRGNHPIVLVQPGRIGFYEVLRKKLYLGEIYAENNSETLSDRLTL